MLQRVLVLLCTLYCIGANHEYDYDYTDFDYSGSGAFGDEIEDIRLVNGSHGDHMGRVEVLYNGTWGTICDDFWSYSDAQVACRMLGYKNARCTLSRALFGPAASDVPIWMDNLQCNGLEESLADCVFNGWGVHSCSHREDAGVICEPDDFIDPPTEVKLLSASTKSITIGWQNPELPPGIQYVRYRLEYTSDSVSYTRAQFLFTTLDPNVTEYNATITGLQRHQLYEVRVRVDIRYDICYVFLEGNYSEPVTFSTNSTLPHSNIPVRLVPPAEGLDFMGRVEVFHRGQWGSVCDDFFSYREASVVCSMLNFTSSVCSVSSARLGQGTGQIWLDDVRCLSSHEILDQCRFQPWGRTNCQHNDDVGVICRPNDFPQPVTNLSISHIGSDSITVRWDPIPILPTLSVVRYRILYQASTITFPRSVVTSGSVSEYKLTRLSFGVNYNLSIRAEVRFTTCYTYLYGPYSDLINATTKETAPTGPPTQFHVVVINSTAILVQWQLPLYNLRNGRIRGYRLYIHPHGGRERHRIIHHNDTTDYIVSELNPNTPYAVSILAYTVEDGPRSILLTAITYPHDLTPMIIWFGINRDGLTRVLRYSFQANVVVHCGVGTNETQIDWFFSNGTKVGIMNRNIREGHFQNGTALLHIGSTRRLNLCDAGVYTCVANTSGHVERKNFTLIVNTAPPAPSRPFLIHATSTSVTIGWDEPECDGGHALVEFTIQYYVQTTTFSFVRNNMLIRNIGPDVRNWTISGLDPETTYGFEVRVSSADFTISRYSTSRFITTLPPAPSEPRDVVVRLVTTSVIEIRWRPPATPTGALIHYTVYAIPLSRFDPTARKRRQALPVAVPATLTKTFPATATAGNLTLPEEAVTYVYQIQMTVSVFVDGEENEGERSEITANSTIFVPLPGLPVPVNLRVGRTTNSSVLLRWDYPPPPTDTIQSFQISYSALVEWRSPEGTLFHFIEEGEASTSETRMLVSPLIPGQSYQFKVSALTEDGRGKEVPVTWRTEDADIEQDKLAFFNIRLGPVSSCLDWHDAASDAGHISDIRNSLLRKLNSLCSCNLTPAHISSEELSCRGALTNQIVYRARLLGSDKYSSSDLLTLLQAWIEAGHASIIAGISRLEIDPTCTVSLDNLQSPDCPLVFIGSPTTPPPVVVLTTVTVPGKTVGAGEVGGIVIGAIIAALLVAVLALLLVVLLRKWRPKKLVQTNGQFRMQSNKEEDKTPFADIDNEAHDSGMYDNGGQVEEKDAL